MESPPNPPPRNPKKCFVTEWWGGCIRYRDADFRGDIPRDVPRVLVIGDTVLPISVLSTRFGIRAVYIRDTYIGVASQ